MLMAIIAVANGLAPRHLHAQAVEIPPEIEQAEAARIAMIANAVRGTICIFDRQGAGGGSGVIVSADGFALTNYHVVQPCGPFMKCGLTDGRLYDAVLVGLDPTGDVAVIKLIGRADFPTAPWGDSDAVEIGDPCFAIGNPFLLAQDFQPTVTRGIISGKGRYQYPDGGLLEYADSLQTDAAINPGNSGGPLFNERGEVVGINGRCSFEKRGRVNVGVGFAISINQIKKFYSLLKGGHIVDHATLGATFRGGPGYEIRVSNLLESSDAYRQGLRFDDRLLKFAGRAMTSTNQFKNYLETFPRGFRVPVEVERQGAVLSFIIELSGVHDPQFLGEVMRDFMPSEKATPSGTSAEVPEEVAKQFRIKSGFANYHFNRLETLRVWQVFTGQREVNQFRGKWQIEGNLGDQRCQIVLDQQRSGLQLPGRIELFDEQIPNAETAPSLEFDTLIGLHALRTLVVDGPAGFGELNYAGKFPVPERRIDCEVLSAVVGSATVKFFFSEDLSRVECLEIDDGERFCRSRLWALEPMAADHWPLAGRYRIDAADGSSSIEIREMRWQSARAQGKGEQP